MHYFLIYDTAPAYLERRAEFRGAHLTLAWQAQERGELVLAGALGDPVSCAMLLFQGDGPGAAERFAQADPYVLNGLVRSWRVEPWHTVVGSAAAAPIRP